MSVSHDNGKDHFATELHLSDTQAAKQQSRSLAAFVVVQSQTCASNSRSITTWL